MYVLDGGDNYTLLMPTERCVINLVPPVEECQDSSQVSLRAKEQRERSYSSYIHHPGCLVW